MSFTKHEATRLYKKLREQEPNQPGVLGLPPGGLGVGVSGDVALATSPAVQTDVLDARITSTTVMGLSPTDLYGSAEIGAGNIYWSSPADGIMRIYHTVSTKTRSFKYLLMFTLAFLLASSAFSQVIYGDGTQMENRPGLNLVGSVCTPDVPVADANNCTVGGGGGGDMFQAAYAQGLYWGFDPSFTVDDAQVSHSADCIDSNRDQLCEIYFNPFGPTGSMDIDGDTCLELLVSPASIEWFSSISNPGVPPPVCVPNPTTLGVISNGATIIGHNTVAKMGDGVWIGNGAGSVGSGQSSGIGRDATTDRLFGDKNINFLTVNTPQAGETYLDEAGGATPPAACQPGDQFLDTDETVGDATCNTIHDNTLCLCIAANTWIAANYDNLTLAGDVDGAYDANDLDELAVETELEGALDIVGDVDGPLTAAVLDIAAVEGPLEAALDFADIQGGDRRIKLSADHTQAAASGTTGTEVTGLQFSVTAAATYDVTYHLIVSSASAGVGLGFAVNYTTSNPSPFICQMIAPTDAPAGGAQTGVLTDIRGPGTPNLAGQFLEWWATQTEGTTAHKLGTNSGWVNVGTGFVLLEIHCLMTAVAGAADIELWHASENGTADTQVRAGSWAELVTLP